MSLFQKVLDYFRQPNMTEELCLAIRSYGADARIIASSPLIHALGNKRRVVKRVPLYLGYGGRGKSVGAIEIPGSPIRWINVLKYPAPVNDPADYVYVFVIPDERVQGNSPIYLKTIGRKNLPWIGVVTSIKWGSNVHTGSIAERLNNLPAINQAIIESRNNGTGSDIEIETDNINGCWLITSSKMPTLKLWQTYELIARELLDSPLTWEPYPFLSL